MMKDIEIKISRETRMVDLSKTTIGNDGENLQGNLVFSFTDGFVKGQGRLEYIINGESKYAFLLSGDENYYIPIKSVMTKEGQIDMQLVITEGTDVNEIPIFKSNVFYVSCKKSINAEVEEEEGYYSWIEIANTKLNEVDEAIEELASQSNYAKEQGDYAKEQGTNAKNIAEETEKKAQEGAFDGKSLEFIWQGTKLGVRLEGQEAYQFVDLQGVQGEIGATGEPFKIKKTYASVSEMNADFRNMEFGDYVMIASSVEVEDNAKLYTKGESAWIFISDFSGAMGIRGETGLTPNIKIGEVKTLEAGSQAKVTRSGSNEEPVFNFELPKGDKGDNYVLTEKDKVEIGEKVNTEYEERITENEKDIVDMETIIDIITPKSPPVKGELVHITDALPLPTFETTTDGNVKQEGEPSPTSPQEIEVLEGYNLIDFNVTQNEKVKVNNDGTISINGNGDFSLKVKPITLKANKNYYIKWELLSGTITGFDKPFQAPNLNWVVKDTFTKLNFTEDKEIKSFWINDSSVFENAVIRMWIATEEKPYLPYGCVGYKVTGKNRLNMSLTQERYEVKLNKIENEKIYLNVTGQSPSLLIKQYIPKGKYKVRKSEAIKGSVAFKSSTDETIGDIGGLVDGEKVIEFSKDINSIVIYLNASYYDTSKEHILDFNSLVMVNENDSTDYEPYKEQIVPLDLKGNWVGKISDTIKDELYTKKKHLLLDKVLKKRVFTGNEEWNTWGVNHSTEGITGFYSMDFNDYNQSLIKYIKSTHFINNANAWGGIEIGINASASGNPYIIMSIPNDALNDISSNAKAVESFKTWLSNNPVEVLYPTKETEIIDLGELPEPIKTFEGVNNIQLLANLDTEIEVKYALDVKKYYDNKLAEISAQII